MSKLLVSTFIRMLKKVIFWFFVLCMFAYGVYSALNIASEARMEFVLDGCLFECLPLMGLISAIFTSLFIGSEYSDGTIRNKIIVGHSRIWIYLANLIVCAIASVLISLSYTVGVFVIGNMNGGELITETATIFLCMISSLMISVTFASIMTLLAILNTNKAGNVVVSMILALVLLVSGSFIHQKLGEPKLYDNYVTVNEMGIPTQIEQLPNPQYIEGTPRIVLEVLSDLLLGYQRTDWFPLRSVHSQCNPGQLRFHFQHGYMLPSLRLPCNNMGCCGREKPPELIDFYHLPVMVLR